MYKSKNKRESLELIEVEVEIALMAQYIQDNWTCPKKTPLDILGLIKAIYSQTNTVAANYFDEYAFLDVYDNWCKWRVEDNKWNNISVEKKDLISSYDALYMVSHALLMDSKKQYDVVVKNLDFTDCYQKNIKNISKDFVNIKKLKPKNLKAIEASMQEDESIEYNGSEFQGLNSAKATNGGFDVLASADHVIYRNHHHNISYATSLWFAIVHHCTAIIEHNNSVNMIIEINALKKHYDRPEYFQDLLYEVDMSFIRHPNLKAILAFNEERQRAIYADRSEWETQIQDAIESKMKFNTMTQEEKDEVIRKNTEEISKMLSGLLKNK